LEPVPCGVTSASAERETIEDAEVDRELGQHAHVEVLAGLGGGRDRAIVGGGARPWQVGARRDGLPVGAEAREAAVGHHEVGAQVHARGLAHERRRVEEHREGVVGARDPGAAAPELVDAHVGELEARGSPSLARGGEGDEGGGDRDGTKLQAHGFPRVPLFFRSVGRSQAASVAQAFTGVALSAALPSFT
jgi:hypothetical protein